MENIIKRAQVYEFDNQRFDSLKDLKTYVIDILLGEGIFYEISKKIDISHEDMVLLHEILTSKKNRNNTAKALSATIEQVNYWDDKEYINLFDLSTQDLKD